MRSTESAAALIASLKEKGFPFVREPRAPNGDFYLGKVDHFEFCPPLSLVDCFFAKCGTVPNPDCPLRHVQHSTLNECKFWKLGVVCKYKKCYYLHPAMRVLQNNFRSVSPNPCKYCSENRMHYSWDCPKRSKHDKELEKIADTLEILLQNGPLSFFEAAGKLEALMSSPVSNRELGAVIHKYPQKFIRQGTIVRLNQYNSRQDAIYNNNNNNNNNSNMATSVLTMPRVTDISMKFSEKWKPREREWSEAEWREFTNDMKIVFYNFCSAPDITPQLRQELGNIVKLFEKNLLHDTRLCCQRFRFVAEQICNIAIQKYFPIEAPNLLKDTFFQKIEKLKQIDFQWANNLHKVRVIGNKAQHDLQTPVSFDDAFKSFTSLWESLRKLQDIKIPTKLSGTYF
jgi:hypothetical protein